MSESVESITVETPRHGLPKEEFDGPGLSPESPPAFPEGGLQAWATVAGAFLVQFCGFGWIGSINTFLLISGGLISGRLFDRGHFHLLMYGGCLLQCFSLFMLSLCKPEQYYQIFLAQGLGTGLGSGAVYVPSVAIVSHYFQKRRTLAMSIVASGSSLGSVIHPIMLNNTFHSRLGFANSVRASAGLVSGLLLIACFLIHPRLPPAQTHPPFWKSLRRFVRDPPYVFATVGMTIYTMGFYFPLFYLQLDAIKHGINETLSFYSLVILNAMSFVGRLTPGFFAHKLGIINMVTAAAGCSAVLIFSMIALKSLASVVVIAVLYGFCAGTFIAMMAPLLASLADNLGELGLRIGAATAMIGLGGLIGPPINGALLTGHFVWWRPALFSGLMASTGFAFFLATLFAVRRKAAMKRNSALSPAEEKDAA
ncbi:MFS general substrate transporter [Mycena latifolia]|nr:MFS general substrate transporter [Mycena latifolia]